MQKLKQNDIIELEIDDLGREGNGIGRINDFVIFVKNSVPGDKIKAVIKKVRKNYAEAVPSILISPSLHRIEPECSHFGTCNGCKMQNLKYDYQLLIKRQIVKNAFERIGGFADQEVPEVLGSDHIYNYRNKIEFSFSNNKWLTEEDLDRKSADKTFAVGFHMPNFIDKVLDVKECFLQSELSNKILNFTRDFFKLRDESIYTTKTHTGYLRYLVIRQSARRGEVSLKRTNPTDLMVNLITSTENEQLMREYCSVIQQEIPEITTLVNTISTTKAQVAQGDYSLIIFGNGYIEEKLGEYTFKITPNSFFQTNTRQAQKLFDTLLNISEFKQNEKILDLYCGTGAISIYISKFAEKVTGIELNKGSIDIAKENAKLNNIKNCEFTSNDVKEYLAAIPANAGISLFDTIILDPPRSGLHPKASEYLLKLEPKKILYVSCNPSTQARDIKMLAEKYSITKMQPVDMFPHTFHIENVVRLDRRFA
jgi:23S rRNA (uracil1939-C5)-methyltransferase